MITGTSSTRHVVGSIARGRGRVGTTSACSIAVQVYGDPDRPVVLVLGGISADRHVADTDTQRGWWRAFVGADRALDPREWCVVGFDYAGGPGDTRLEVGPAGIDTRDQARAARLVLQGLRRDRFHAVVGASYGGMVALALAEECPQLVGRLVVIGAAHRPHPMATGLRSLQRRIVRLGLETGRAGDGVAIARGLAMTTYRTAEEFRTRFRAGVVRGADDRRFEVESYLEQRGDAFARMCSPREFLSLSESIDRHWVYPERIAVPASFVSFDPDAVVPRWLVRELGERYHGSSRVVELQSVYGHDAFLKEVDALTPVIRRGVEVPSD